MQRISTAAQAKPNRRNFLWSAGAAGMGGAGLLSGQPLFAQRMDAGLMGSLSRPIGASGIRKALGERAASLAIFDTHEHLRRESERLERPGDVFLLLSHYVSNDLRSAGMDPKALSELQNASIPLEVRWKSVAPYWAAVSTTGYGRCARIAARDLYGAESIDERTYRTISERIRAAERPGLYRKVLKEKARIELSVLDDLGRMTGQPLRPDPEFYQLVVRFDYLVMASTRKQLEHVEKMTQVAVHSLADMVRAMETRMDRALQEGMAGLKIGFAYQRSLDIQDPDKGDAERAFEKIFAAGAEGAPDPATAKVLQDYLVQRQMEMAAARNLPVQMHTGLLAGNRNENLRTNPSLLVPLINKHTKVRFGLFHGGYPYTSEFAAIAKNCPNVYPDLCWLHIIAPSAAARLLDELIDTVPNNKICGFGGDFFHVEGAYAHAQMARAITVEVLAAKVERGQVTEQDAMMLLERILRKNGMELFARKAGAVAAERAKAAVA